MQVAAELAAMKRPVALRTGGRDREKQAMLASLATVAGGAPSPSAAPFRQSAIGPCAGHDSSSATPGRVPGHSLRMQLTVASMGFGWMNLLLEGYYLADFLQLVVANRKIAFLIVLLERASYGYCFV